MKYFRQRPTSINYCKKKWALRTNNFCFLRKCNCLLIFFAPHEAELCVIVDNNDLGKKDKVAAVIQQGRLLRAMREYIATEQTNNFKRV